MTTQSSLDHWAPSSKPVPASRGDNVRRHCPMAGPPDGRWHLTIGIADIFVESVRPQILVVMDEVGIVLAASSGLTMRGARVVQELDTLSAIYGLPSGIVTDHDSAFAEQVVHEWAYRNGVAWFYEASMPRPRTWKL